jgi:Protein of unknown function (Porph_ging).
MAMKLRHTLMLLLFFVAASARAQETPQPQAFEEGTIRYLCTHNWVKKMASVTYISQQSKEKSAYMWGKRSEWREYTLLHLTPAATKYEDSEEKANEDYVGYNWRKETFWVQRDFANNTMSEASIVSGKTYLLEDSLQCQNWKILNDLKEVAGHLCMNAVWEDSIKQQKIVAWFALDIPHPGGPERLCGLPGLILEADVCDGALVITANRFEPKKLTKELEMPKKVKGKKCDAEGYRAALKKYMAECKQNDVPYFWELRY